MRTWEDFNKAKDRKVFEAMDTASKKQMLKAITPGSGEERPGHKYHHREWSTEKNKWIYVYISATGKAFVGEKPLESEIKKCPSYQQEGVLTDEDKVPFHPYPKWIKKLGAVTIPRPIPSNKNAEGKSETKYHSFEVIGDDGEKEVWSTYDMLKEGWIKKDEPITIEEAKKHLEKKFGKQGYEVEGGGEAKESSQSDKMETVKKEIGVSKPKREYVNEQQETAIGDIQEEHDIKDGYQVVMLPYKNALLIGKNSKGEDKAFVIDTDGNYHPSGIYPGKK